MEVNKTLRLGVRVKLQNLNAAAQYNGTEGTITGWDEKHSRWKVTMDLDNSTKALRDTNMVFTGMTKELKEKEGFVDYDAKKKELLAEAEIEMKAAATSLENAKEAMKELRLNQPTLETIRAAREERRKQEAEKRKKELEEREKMKKGLPWAGDGKDLFGLKGKQWVRPDRRNSYRDRAFDDHQ